MVKQSTMENKPKINEMGNEVVEGFNCKPKDYDASRPIMHYKTLLLLCDDERCQKAGGVTKPQELRDLLKKLELNKGENRIKITRTFCNGACRFRQVAHISKNASTQDQLTNNGTWLKQTHRLSLDDWAKLFQAIADEKDLTQLLPAEKFVPMKLYN